MTEAVLTLVALLVGLALGLALGRRGGAQAADAAREAAGEAVRERDEGRRAVDLARQEREATRDERDAARRELAALQARHEERERAWREAQTQSREVFQATAGEVLKANTEEFLKLAKTRFERSEAHGAQELDKRRQAIEQLVKPLQEKLEAVTKATRELEVKRERAYGEIETHVKQLAASTTELQRSSHALGEALRGSSQARGRWGEMALRNIAEVAGMTEHCDFEVQVTDSDGQRPDMLVKLPGGGAIPVDAKAPFTDYQKACETNDAAEQQRLLTAHAAALRTRVRELAKKDYSRSLETPVDYVVMFVPADAVLSAAFQVNPGLQAEALRDRVLIATPVTLVALLRTVGIYWDQEKLARNAHEAVEVAIEFHKRVGIFADHVARVGKGLDNAVAAYNTAVGSFESRVLVQGRRLESLGVVRDASRKLETPAPVGKALREPSAAAGLFATGTVDEEEDEGAEEEGDPDAAEGLRAPPGDGVAPDPPAATAPTRGPEEPS